MSKHIGSWITKGGRKKVLKLSVVPGRRPWLDGLFSSAEGFSPPMLGELHEKALPFLEI